ncbi:unnamed protein product [Cuscuta epithymum]|uniref:Retrotransposon gag domain-containing protein n=1 Tax=Cuscuta epithymum TaxID=186058 RepID=A0AAV0CIK1_9ASTE|nr:unnamed protein product [Cuscuta epithymum]
MASVAAFDSSNSPSVSASAGQSSPVMVSSTGASSPFGTQQPVIMPGTAAQSASSFSSPTRGLSSSSLFQNMPPIFTWSAPHSASQFTLDPPPSFSMPMTLPQTLSTAPAVTFSGPTFVGSPGVSSMLPAQRAVTSPVISTPMATLAQTVSHVATNVTNIVTTRLQAVEDYSTWRTQFESFLVSQGLLGMVDGTIQVPSPHSIDVSNRPIPNPEYSSWLRIDQTIRSWIFATLSRDVLIDVRDLKHSFGIWERLESRFMSASLARSMELRHMLNTIKKKPDQSMDSYLREVKILVDDLACINCPVSHLDMLKSIIMGLGKDYASMINTVTMFPQNFPYETLRNHLIEIEQRDRFFQQQEALASHQAFVAPVQPQPGVQRPPTPAGRSRGGRGHGTRGRGGRGRGRYQQHYGQHSGQQASYGPSGQFYGGGASVAVPGTHAGGAQSQHNNTTGFPSDGGILGSAPPPIVCQICFSTGHSAIACPSRFSQPSAPALLTTPGETNPALWYPDSGASAHMTPSKGQTHGNSSSASFQ